MKDTQLQELLTTNGIELGENVDIKAIAQGINDVFNPIIQNQVSKATKGLMSQDDFIKQYDFENVDQFNAFVKNTKSASSELSEKATRLETELNEWKTKATDFESKVKDYEFTSTLRSKGIADDKLDYAKFKLSSMINEETDLDSALSTLMESDSVLKPTDDGNKGFKVGAEPKDKKPAPNADYLKAKYKNSPFYKG